MDCVIIAGGIPGPDDPLYAYTQDKPKALISMHGRTMLERVVDAVQDSQNIEEIVVVGIGSDMGMQFKRPVHHLPDQGGLISNALAGIDWLSANRPKAESFLASSADIPLLTGPMIDEYIESCQPLDKAFYYIMVTKETMEARFPNSNRTFTKLKGIEIAGGDLGIMKFEVTHRNRELWEMMANARKHAWQLARGVGLKIMFKLLTRQLSVAEIEETASRLIGAPAQVVFCERAELAMDGDKPHQIDLLRDELNLQST
jgi:GTP:adenosylcobinamide-phosphate guanylyltransferase